MPDDNELILDYASPRKRVRFRLPAKSSLLVVGDPDWVVITEKLAGDQGAIPALCFAGFVLLFTLGCVLPINGQKVFRSEIVFWFIQATAQIVVMILLIQQTWRQTILTIHYNQQLLRFRSPLRNRRYEFAGDQIAEMRISETANQQTRSSLGELIIVRTSGGEIRLFTDHRTEELIDLLGSIEPMLRDGQWVPPTATAVAAGLIKPKPIVPIIPPDLESNAMNTALRLRERQRQISDRLRPKQPPPDGN